MRGLDASSGTLLDDLAHLRQSIGDILTTRRGTRLMRPTYGSRLPELLDHPVNDDTLVEIYAETAQALDEWEPRIRVKRVRLTALSADGIATIDLSGTYLHDGQVFTLEGIQVDRFQ